MNPFAALDLTRWLVWGVVIASAVSVVWMHGYSRGERKLFEYQAEQARAAVPVIVRQGAVTERVVVKYRTRLVEVQAATVTITREIPRHVPPAVDPMLPVGWLLLHDAAARAVPPAPGGVDVTSPGARASQAIETVAGNYGACHANAEQLNGLQAWVREQFEAMNGEALGY
jgi:hypothetical protein